MFHNFPETVKNLELLCKTANLPYKSPDNQTCCGLPYFEKGELKAAKTIAEYNLSVFGESEIICSSLKCEDTYKVKYPKIFNNTVSHIQATKLSSSAKGLSYLFEKLDLKQSDKLTSSYFFIPDCATEKEIQLTWLTKLNKAQFYFPKLENTCCGAGYCLPAQNGQEAEKMTMNLIQQAIACGAENILTANEICLQQTIHIIKKHNYPINALHIIDLFAQAL